MKKIIVKNLEQNNIDKMKPYKQEFQNQIFINLDNQMTNIVQVMLSIAC
jgi:hypothetical protein